MPKPKQQSAADRARRLLGLLSHLTPGASIPLGELAAALGATEAEVTRDLGTLSMCGVPPYDPYDLIDVFLEDDGRVHVYSELPALARPVRLNAEEARALAAALRACGFAADDALLAKIEAAAVPSAAPEDVERLVRARAAGGSADVYGTLARAIEDATKVEAVYLSAGAPEASCRTLRPYGLGWREGAWYLYAFCESAAEERTFRVDRFLAVTPTAERFEPPRERPSAAPDFSADELPVATLRFAPGVRVSEREWPGATFEPAEDGATLARVPYSSLRWLAREVASLLGAVVVLHPSEARAAVREVAAHDLTTRS